MPSPTIVLSFLFFLWRVVADKPSVRAQASEAGEGAIAHTITCLSFFFRLGERVASYLPTIIPFVTAPVLPLHTRISFSHCYLWIGRSMCVCVCLCLLISGNAGWF